MIKIDYNDESISVEDINVYLKMESDDNSLIYIYKTYPIIENEDDLLND